MSKIYIRLNGRGNAWPTQIGLDHPYYEKNYVDNSNVSFSIIQAADKTFTKENIDWELLIDAGHGAVQHIITRENRIPEAILLTHAHHDHTFGIDWVVQSYFRQNDGKKYPVYATLPAWEFVIQSYPHLAGMVEFKELKAGQTITLDEADIQVTPFPVFHGESASGACLLVFEKNKKKAVISGDVLSPLIRKTDYQKIRFSKYFFVDSNNRFPYPKSNHWSLANGQENSKSSRFLTDWAKNVKLSHFIAPNLPVKFDETIHEYFDHFLEDQFHENKLYFTVFDFIDEFKPENVMMVHYSGAEDVKYYKEKQLMDFQLEHWANQEAKSIELSAKFFAPKVGDVFEL